LNLLEIGHWYGTCRVFDGSIDGSQNPINVGPTFTAAFLALEKKNLGDVKCIVDTILQLKNSPYYAG
jgi:hypothetical protein